LIQEKQDSISIQFLFRQSLPAEAPDDAEHAPSQPPLKKSTQWTNRLGSSVDEKNISTNLENPESGTRPRIHARSTTLSDILNNDGRETILRLEGPYFTPCNPENYETVVCLVAGTGLSGAIAIAAAFKAEKARFRPKANANAAAPATSEASTKSAERYGRWDRCIVIWTVREKDYVEMPFFQGEAL
jgi:hypothetical protein